MTIQLEKTGEYPEKLPSYPKSLATYHMPDRLTSNPVNGEGESCLQ